MILKKVISLLELLEIDPFTTRPTFEKLVSIESIYSRRINLQHRLVYQVYLEEKIIKIIRMWTYYEKI